MPGGPDRANFISGMMDWCGNSIHGGKLHAAAAKIYIKGKITTDRICDDILFLTNFNIFVFLLNSRAMF